jgi:hypothetical protein
MDAIPFRVTRLVCVETRRSGTSSGPSSISFVNALLTVAFFPYQPILHEVVPATLLDCAG